MTFYKGVFYSILVAKNNKTCIKLRIGKVCFIAHKCMLSLCMRNNVLTKQHEKPSEETSTD